MSEVIHKFIDRFNIELGYSDHFDGGMSYHRGITEEVFLNRSNYFTKVKIPLEETCWADLVHGSRVQIVTQNSKGCGAYSKTDAISQTDGMWTRDRNLVLCTTHADCLPLYCIAEDIIAVGIAHCGWRSITQELPIRMVKNATSSFSTKSQSMRFLIGKGIRQECFQISEKIIDEFHPDCIQTIEEKWYVDLPKQIKLQLLQCGVDPEKIFDEGICTHCTPLFSSYRREKNQVSPSVAWIQLLDD